MQKSIYGFLKNKFLKERPQSMYYVCKYTCYCTCFHFYSTMYIPAWESRAIAVYGRKYVVQRNRILSTAFYLKKLLNGTPITEMHSRRERGQNIRDQIAEIVKAKIWLVYTSKTLCKNRFRWFFLKLKLTQRMRIFEFWNKYCCFKGESC